MNKRIKKIGAIGLSMIMLLSMSSLAFAEENETEAAQISKSMQTQSEHPMGEKPNGDMLNDTQGRMPEDMQGVEMENKNVPNKNSFADVSQDAWYSEYVEFVSMRGIMKGKDGMFGPADTTTRGEYMLALYNAAGAPEVTESSSFTDVDETSEYADAVAWAEANGIASGTGDGTFMPDSPLTREMAMTFLYRALDALNITADIPSDSVIVDFSDNDSVSSWADEAMNTLVNMGIISGTNEGKLNPQGNLVNSEVAAMIYRILGGDSQMSEKPNNLGQGGKGEKSEMTEEENAAKIEELKTDLAAKLEAGEITQDEYGEAVAMIESGNFMFDGHGGRQWNETPPTPPENEITEE